MKAERQNCMESIGNTQLLNFKMYTTYYY